MATQNPASTKQPSREPSRGKVQDLPGCIKYILLVFVILLFLAELYSGEFRSFPDLSWVIWIVLLIKLALIALLLWLIKVQKTLKCKITNPIADECVTEEIDTVNAIQFISVKGTASGSVFGHYTLAISGAYPYNVIYPAGGGTVPVNNGDLGKIDTTALFDGDYTITLTVFPIGAGSPKICTVKFTLLKIAVYITNAAGVLTVPNAFDETAEFVQGAHVVSIGGSIHLDGAAYVYACTDRKIERYEIRYSRVIAPGPGPVQPAFDVPIPADWPAGNLIHPPLVYDASKYWNWTRVGPAPMNLVNDWTTLHLGAPSPGGADYPCLSHTAWNSFATTGADHGGRYHLLLIVTDTQAHRYYDLQRIWVDNWQVQCYILKLQRPGDPNASPPEPSWVDLPPCTDIHMKWKKLRIWGVAWDALIDSAWPATAPNDNFLDYSVSYAKEFVPGSVAIVNSTNRVPSGLIFPGPTFMPTPADADELAIWDLTTLDEGVPPPTGDCDDPLPAGHEHNLWRGCACTYNLDIGANDATKEEGASSIHHPSPPSIPIKIINDL